MLIAREQKWHKASCWIASFDILGFSNLIDIDHDTLAVEFVIGDYEETLRHLKSRCDVYEPGCLDYLWFSDTFVMFTPDDTPKSYAVIQQAAKHFIERCLYSSIPIRGAISVGAFVRGHDNRALIGRAFLDAHLFGEDQDWLGLILTPTAIQMLALYGLKPSRHDFIASTEIPMRKYREKEVMAYRFQNGVANFSSPLLPVLESMKQRADITYCGKYERTIEFIKKHYRYIEA